MNVIAFGQARWRARTGSDPLNSIGSVSTIALILAYDASRESMGEVSAARPPEAQEDYGWQVTWTDLSCFPGCDPAGTGCSAPASPRSSGNPPTPGRAPCGRSCLGWWGRVVCVRVLGRVRGVGRVVRRRGRGRRLVRLGRGSIRRRRYGSGWSYECRAFTREQYGRMTRVSLTSGPTWADAKGMRKRSSRGGWMSVASCRSNDSSVGACITREDKTASVSMSTEG